MYHHFVAQCPDQEILLVAQTPHFLVMVADHLLVLWGFFPVIDHQLAELCLLLAQPIKR